METICFIKFTFLTRDSLQIKKLYTRDISQVKKNNDPNIMNNIPVHKVLVNQSSVDQSLDQSKLSHNHTGLLLMPPVEESAFKLQNTKHKNETLLK